MASRFHLLCLSLHVSLPKSQVASCPTDLLQLGVCADLLSGLLYITVGTPPKMPCCSPLDGLVNFEAATCLCTALQDNVVGTSLNVPVDLALLLNYCGRNVPAGFTCA